MNKITVKKELGKCCDDMESAISSKFLAIKNGEIFFNLAKTPLSAGNVLTGETFDPKNYPYSMSLYYCPFCSYMIGKKPKNLEDEIG